MTPVENIAGVCPKSAPAMIERSVCQWWMVEKKLQSFVVSGYLYT
jgi:hypothetical protein